ncbi:hypothetical protein CSU32_06125 [Salmonella enterica subsp. diarizonae]|uniref:Uncharacterized protein n=2 Tax=Salmonella enterica TaxID=28901 RepID=A0A5U3ELZ7_SALET|nr:hypothetical protein [Salmonella enterica subsp. diarizonae]EAB1656926.1 hypothetical protein [Salmonella enterica]EBP4001163.1 hypothetical protein [Salmonella enterica subsp. enterica]EBW1592484.1 hypothetical protein [Salmonella enterica subsp. diarizonae serovar 61:r:z]HCM1889882.1 hypothetical protein [Salmonella enterica subsp. diarizonae serovar 57:c:z]
MKKSSRLNDKLLAPPLQVAQQLSRGFTSISESSFIELQRVAAWMEAGAAAICEAINSRRDGVVGVCESSQNAETADVRVSPIRANETTGDEFSGVKGAIPIEYNAFISSV